MNSKTLICVAVLALVALAIARPAFNQAAINSLNQLAEIEGILHKLKKIGGKALKGALRLSPGARRLYETWCPPYCG